jgi:hypothetical protein
MSYGLAEWKRRAAQLCLKREDVRGSERVVGAMPAVDVRRVPPFALLWPEVGSKEDQHCLVRSQTKKVFMSGKD